MYQIVLAEVTQKFVPVQQILAAMFGLEMQTSLSIFSKNCCLQVDSNKKPSLMIFMTLISRNITYFIHEIN